MEGKPELGATSLLLDPICNLCHIVISFAALSHQALDLLVCMHHCGVVPAAKGFADLRKGQIR